MQILKLKSWPKQFLDYLPLACTLHHEKEVGLYTFEPCYTKDHVKLSRLLNGATYPENNLLWDEKILNYTTEQQAFYMGTSIILLDTIQWPMAVVQW